MGRRYLGRTRRTPGASKKRDTPDLEVLQTESNPVLLPGDGRQKQPLCAVTWIQREEKDDSGESNAGTGRRNLGKAANREGIENYDRGILVDSRVETSGEELGVSTSTAGHRRGPGGTKPKLQPRSGKSVAIAGVWDTHTRNREVEGTKEGGSKDSTTEG
ncbi:hypothetical protein NDU88_005991 [Pleurodeles waltl]|uniref:Uncharacterized protein n=1 Tax=Pleurodeles waltl TaxID=8319 RepID=A0AAV7VKN7_PLEWA|nr:hypothetical protein NDU88_005991 [Pleurodeles waltl]